MCPSYMATREEKHSTRGRARLLFEMLEGDPLKDGWRDDNVKEALDLCLSCKGCRGECPVNVDMATYKAEFLSHYYKGRRRPVAAYAFGLMYWWARIAAHVPRTANFFTQTPGLRTHCQGDCDDGAGAADSGVRPPDLSRLVRQAPRCATRESRRSSSGPTPGTITSTRRRRRRRSRCSRRPASRCSFRRVSLCCGRPLYDYGMLTLARRMLLRVLDALRPRSAPASASSASSRAACRSFATS